MNPNTMEECTTANGMNPIISYTFKPGSIVLRFSSPVDVGTLVQHVSNNTQGELETLNSFTLSADKMTLEISIPVMTPESINVVVV